MPDVLAEVKGNWLQGRGPAFLDAIHAALVEALQTPPHDKVLRLVEHSATSFTIPRGASEKFTHIEITMFVGRSLDAKRALYKAIVGRLQAFGIPPEDVKVILHEVTAENVGFREGKAACDVELGYPVNV
jgi:hypothetical protein